MIGCIVQERIKDIKFTSSCKSYGLFFASVSHQPVEDRDKTAARDKEKTRMSLLEEELSDALSLLLQLRHKVCNPGWSRSAT